MTSALNKAALEATHARRIYFLFLDLASEPLRACTGARTYTTLSNDWLGIGEIQGISDLAEAADLSARPVTLTLSAADSFITEPFLSRTNYKNRSAVIYRGTLDADGDLIDTPDRLWTGRMDVGSVVRGDENIAQITCEPLSARAMRVNISRYSDQDHQLRHSGDRFYEFLAQMEKKDVTWGGQRIAPRGGGGAPGWVPGLNDYNDINDWLGGRQSR